jgi:hypothetical protein
MKDTLGILSHEMRCDIEEMSARKYATARGLTATNALYFFPYKSNRQLQVNQRLIHQGNQFHNHKFTRFCPQLGV